MTRRKRKEETVEDRFPNARARKAADEAIDVLDPKLAMTIFLDVWESAYFAACGESPFRGDP